MTTTRTAHLLALSLALVATAAGGQKPASAGANRGGANAVTPGELVVEPATLINLGFEWWIEGDDNRNASVAVSFRERGQSDWRPALPLLRLHGERIYRESQIDVVAPNMFAGSILDLEPDTEYEARFVMSDADGVRGEAQRTATGAHARGAGTVSRRARVPRLPAWLHGAKSRARVRRAHVRLQRMVRGHGLGDVGPAARAARRHDSRACRRLSIQPLRVHERRGREPHDAARRHVLPDRRRHCRAPISIVAAGDGEVVFDGNGNYALFDVRAADYTYFEGITFRNAEVAILAGTQFIAGSKGLTVKRSTSSASAPACSRTGPGRAASTSPTTCSSAATTRIT